MLSPFAHCRYRVHVVTSGENRVAGNTCTSRYVAEFFTRLSQSRRRIRARSRVRKCFPFFSRRTCVSPFYTPKFRGTRKRAFCESTSVYEGDRRRFGGREGWMDQLSTSRAVRSLSAAEIGPNRVNGKLCKLQRKNE